jgi:hypothetical protein
VSLKATPALSPDVILTSVSVGFLKIQGLPLEAAQHVFSIVQGGFEGCSSVLTKVGFA